MNIGELFVTLGIKGQGLGTLKEVAEKIANLPVDAAAAIAGMAGISLELGRMAEEAINTSVAFQAFSNQTGLSWQELQKWQIVATQANVSAQAVATSVSTLERNLAEIRLGRGNIAPFQMLGISPVGQDAFGVLRQLRERIKNMNPATATNIASQMGLSPEMMNVLRLSDKQFTEFANHVHGLTERQEKDFLDAKLAITQFGETFKYMMFGVLSHFVEAIEKGAQFKGMIQTLGVAAAMLAVYFFPVTAAMGALLLVLDDLAVYSTGGKSLTGEGLKALHKFFDDLAKDHPKAIPAIELLERLAGVLKEIANFDPVKAGASLRNTLEGWFVAGPTDFLRSHLGGGDQQSTTNQANVNVNVNNDSGSLDLPGWKDIAHMIERSIASAHGQLNN